MKFSVFEAVLIVLICAQLILASNEQTAICDFVQSTSISRSITSWSCSNGIPRTNYCSWTGITCSGSSVIKIVASNLQIAGTIPSSFGNLQNLQVLSLPLNNLLGTLPSSIGNLTNLLRLNLNSNALTGILP